MRSREARLGLTAFGIAAALATGAGFWIGWQSGILVLCVCGGFFAAFLTILMQRRRNLKRLSEDLDKLLHDGRPLPIHAYAEGEISILANQLQKLTLRLTEAAEVLKEDKDRLADAMANISHQLRTPLTAMNLTASMLSAPDLKPERRKALAAEMKTLLARTDWLIEALLKLSKLDAGTVKLAKRQISAEDVIRRAAEGLAIPIELREQRLVCWCQEVCLNVDPVWTAEALGNILKNCVEHTPAGGCITVSVSQTALFEQIVIADTGPGFSEKDIPHLFERFYKGENASENSYGIGLSLARTIISAQNGTIKAANGAQGGAVFTIKFYKQVI